MQGGYGPPPGAPGPYAPGQQPMQVCCIAMAVYACLTQPMLVCAVLQYIYISHPAPLPPLSMAAHPRQTTHSTKALPLPDRINSRPPANPSHNNTTHNINQPLLPIITNSFSKACLLPRNISSPLPTPSINNNHHPRVQISHSTNKDPLPTHNSNNHHRRAQISRSNTDQARHLTSHSTNSRRTLVSINSLHMGCPALGLRAQPGPEGSRCDMAGTVDPISLSPYTRA